MGDVAEVEEAALVYILQCNIAIFSEVKGLNTHADRDRYR